jgi:hypothetical protein
MVDVERKISLLSVSFALYLCRPGVSLFPTQKQEGSVLTKLKTATVARQYFIYAKKDRV